MAWAVRLVVSREHHDLEPERLEAGDSFFRVLLDRVRDRNDAGCLVVHCHEHGRFALR